MVAEPGVAPGLGDYEPPVRLYTTPRVVGVYLSLCAWSMKTLTISKIESHQEIYFA